MGAPSFDEFAAKASSLYPTATEAQIREAFAAKYSGDPVRTQGPTRDQFGARAEQLYPGVGTDQVDQAYEAKYGAPFLTETKRTLLSSAVAPMAKFGGAFLGGMDSMLDFAPGTGLFDRMGEATFNFGQRLQDENAPSADLQQRSNLNPYKLSQNVLGAAGQMLTQIPTMGAGSAALSIDDAAALEAENLKAGMSPAEARARAIGYAMVSGGLETVGLGRIVKRVPGRLAAGLTEAATEVGQGIARDVAGNNNPLTGLGDTLTGEGLPAFIVGAAFGKGPLRTPKEGETPAPQAEFEQNLAAAAGNDNPMGEPMSDLAAQGADVGTRRRGLYLAPEDAGKDPAPGLIRVPDGQGGEMLVATQEDAQAFQDEIGAAADEPARQAIIGAWTGAGQGKPPDSPDNLVVQQVDEAGNVTRESVVKPDQAEATRNKFAEIGRTVRIITPFEAVQRRMELRRAEVSRETKPADPIAPEPAPPVQAKDESPSDFAARQKAYLKGVVDMRPLPALADMPKDPTSYFTDEGDGIIPLDNLNRGKPEDASSASNGLKRMFAAARGQIAKRPPLTVQADGQGNLTVKDGNGTLGALKAAGLEGAPVRITLPIPDDAGTPDEVAAWRSYEKRLPGPWKKYLVGLARDAQAFLPDFRKGLEDIAQQVVGNRASPFKNPVPGAVVADIKSDGKKGWGRVAEKLIVEDNVEQTVPSADALKDMNRATLLVNTREQLQQALEETIGKFGLGAPKIRNTLLTARTFEDVVASDPYGYADVKINVAGPNGRIYEVQFATPELFAAKNGKGHKLYEEGRAREGLVRDKLRAIYGTRQMAIEDAAKAVEAGVRMFRGRDKRMLEIYAESQALYRAPIEAFLASSATRMNSASETSDPLARTAEGVENINPVVPQTMATGSQMTAGLPSTSQYVEPAGNIFAPLVTGNSVASESYEIKSPSGVAIQARERIADLDALVASDDPRFPAELQPRDRGKRASLSEQVRSIAENLDPRRLGKWWATDDGAPIVSPQGVVESGNGRTFALRVAREKYPERYAAYQAWLQDYAAKAGLDLGGLANPVLVQERVTPMDARTLRLFTGDANRSNKANLSASEVARVDAALLDARMLALLKSGDVTQAQNADFMAAFISALPVGEQNSLRTAGGQGSADGFRRAEAALIAYAYGPGVEVNPLLDRLYESGHDEPVRRLTNAMKAAAFKIAQLREAVQSGNVAIDYDIGKQIVLAYNAAREGLASGASWQSIIAQRDMMGDPLRDLVLQTFVKKDGKTPQTQDRIAAQLVYYGHQAQQQSQSQGGLFGDAVPAEDILQAALRDIGHSNRDLPDSVEFASRTGEAGRGMDAWNLRLAILRTLDSWNPDIAPTVRIVQSPGELPAHILASLGPEINGAADLDNGIIYLVADNIPGPWAAQRVLLHEAVGHYGFMRLFGDRFEKIAEDVTRLAEQDADVRRVARTVDEKYGALDRNTRVAEIIAHLAETQPKHPLASRIIAAFREMLRALGFRINLSKADLVHLIRKSADSMLDPSGPQGGRNQRYESDPARRWNVPAGRPFARQGDQAVQQAPATDEFGRPKDEQGRTLDWNGNPIPEGQQELPGFTDTPTQAQGEAPFLEVQQQPAELVGQQRDMIGLNAEANAPIRGNAPAPDMTPSMPSQGQGRLFASRPGAAPPVQTRVEVGGGNYSLAQFGRLNPQELNVLTSVMNTLEEPVEYQRRGTRPWSATEQAALDMLQQKFGLTLSSLVNRKQGSAANAEQLEAYGILISEASRNIRQLAEQVAATRNPTSDDLARLASAREKLGMLIAPAMGYRSEAGRSLNILKKMSADMRTADGLLEAMGDGTEETLKDFARRVNQAGSIDQIVGVTIGSYKPTLWDKFYEYWINGLLSGPTTHSVNIFSNGLFMALEQGAEFVASASGAVSPRAAAARVAAIPHGVTMGLKNGLEAFLTEQAITTPEGTNEQNRKAIGGTLGKVVRIPGRALQAEDEFFKSIAYQGQLSALAMEQAIREAPDAPMERFREIMGAPTADLIKSARAHAARMTFTTPLGPLGASITAVLNKSKVGRIIVPFVRTPTNILKRALEYTPGAPLMEQVRNDLMGRSGAASPQGELFGQPESPDALAKRAQAMAWSRMAVGSSIMLGVVSLAAQGMLSGAGPDDDDERALLMRQGWRPYSVRLEDGSWIRYNRFEPFGMLMGLAADFAEIGGALSAGEIDKIGSMLMTSLATNLGDKTFLRGITEFSQAYADPKRYMQRWAQSMAASPIPNVAAQTARYLDPYQREARTLVDSWKAKIPGMTTDLAQRLDIAGEPIKRDTGIPGNPFQVSEPKQDALAKAMVRLGVNKGAPSRTIQAGGNAFKLGDQDYQAFKGYVQKARWSILTPLVNSPQFRDLEARNPAAAQQILDKQYEDIGRQARTAWIFKNPHALSARKGERSTTLANSYQ